jgi:acyl-CoA dehydrogenase
VRSVVELPVYFRPEHHALAERLDALGGFSRGPESCVKELADRGLFELIAPVDGAPDVVSLCLARERLAALSPQADSIFAVQGLGSTPLRLAGHPELDKWLAGVREGRVVFGFALTEPEAGSDVASMQATATREPDGRWLFEGKKTLISNVGIATWFTLFVNADPDKGRRGITAFLIPGNHADERLIEGSYDHPLGELDLDGARLTDEMRLGEVGDGFKLAMRTLDQFRVTVGAAAIGMAGRALELALRHARTRRQFGGPLVDKQIIQAYLADMSTELEASRALVYRAAHKLARGERATREVAEAKLFATEAAHRIIDRAVQIHGGRGVVRDEEIEILYRAIRPLRIYEGTSEIQKLIICRELLR